MSTVIQGVRVVTPDDLIRLEAGIRSLERWSQTVERSVNTQFSELRTALQTAEENIQEQARSIQSLESSLKGLDTRLTKEVAQLNQTLDSISDEAARETDLIKQVSGHLGKHNELMSGLVSEVTTENSLEVARQQELSEKFEQLISQQRSQTDSLRQVFADLHQKLIELEHAEQIGGRAIEEAVRVMSGAVETIQANLREEVLNSTMNIQHYTSEKKNRSIEETASLQNIIDLQGQTRERLETIHGIVSGLATTGQKAEYEQKQRLTRLREAQAQTFNDQSAYYLQTGQAALAVSLLEQAFSISNHAIIRTNLALAYIQMGQFERAENILAELEQENYDTPEIYHQIGVFHLEHDHPTAALPYLVKAIGKAPEDIHILLSLGKAYYACGQVAQAMAAWKQVAARQPDLILEDVNLRILYEEQLKLEAKS